MVLFYIGLLATSFFNLDSVVCLYEGVSEGY